MPDRPEYELTTDAAREIYGADGTFSEAATSTEIETLDTATPGFVAAPA